MTSPKVLPEALIEELRWRPVTEPPVAISVISRFYDDEMGDYVYQVIDPGMHIAPGSEWLPLSGLDAISALIAEVKAARASRVLQDEGVVAPDLCAAFEHEVTQQTQAYQFKPGASPGTWLFRCDEWFDLSRILSAILPSTIGGSVGVSEERVEAFRRDMARSVGSALNLAFMNSTSDEQRDKALHQITQAAVLNFIHTLSPSIQAQER